VRVVLDECVPERLRAHLTGQEIHTVRYAGLSVKKNGEFLRLAEEAGYDIDTLKQMVKAAGRSLNNLSRDKSSSWTIQRPVKPEGPAKRAC
jgi:hypothetical protein